MLQRQKLARETPERTGGGNGLRERLLTEPRSVTVRHSAFPFYLVQDSNGLAYCMGIRIRLRKGPGQ